MGRQINFFAGREDISEIVRVINNSDQVAILQHSSDTGKPDEMAFLQVEKLECSAAVVFLCLRTDLDRVRLRKASKTDMYYFDVFSQPVVEFMCLPFLNNCRRINPSRLYYVEKYWNDDEVLERKPQHFLNWAETLFKDLKKSLKKIEHGYYAGEQALKLRETGISFAGLDVPLGPDKPT